MNATVQSHPEFSSSGHGAPQPPTRTPRLLPPAPASNGVAHEERNHFLEAALSLLEERDGRLSRFSQASKVTKKGILNVADYKASGVQTWEAKFAELRFGSITLSDVDSWGDDHREVLHLRHGSCTIAPHRGRGAASAFEISVHGRRRCICAAANRKQCKEWIDAVERNIVGGGGNAPGLGGGAHGGAVGDGAHRGNKPVVTDEASHAAGDMERFLSLRRGFQDSKSREHYVALLRGDENLGRAVLVAPVGWVRREVAGQADGSDAMDCDVAQLCKDMQRDRMIIDGVEYRGEDGLDAIVGALVRRIIGCADAAAAMHPATPLANMTPKAALTAARDVLLACNRTQSGGDSYLCVDALCSCPAQVVICPNSKEAEPIRVRIHLGTEAEGGTPDAADAPASSSPKLQGEDPPGASLRAGGGDRHGWTGWEGKMSHISLFSPFTRLIHDSSSSGPSQAARPRKSILSHNVVSHSVAGDLMGIKQPGPTPTNERLAPDMPSVVIIDVDAASEFRICTADPMDDSSDLWAVVEATWSQRYRIRFGGLHNTRADYSADDPTVSIAFSATGGAPEENREEEEEEEKGRDPQWKPNVDHAPRSPVTSDVDANVFDVLLSRQVQGGVGSEASVPQQQQQEHRVRERPLSWHGVMRHEMPSPAELGFRAEEGELNGRN